MPFSYLSLVAARDQIAHAFFPSDAAAAVRWSTRTGRPSVFSYMGLPDRPVLADRRHKLRLLEYVTRGATEVVVLSQAAAEGMRRWLGVSPRVIYPGVDLEAFSPGAASDRAPEPTIFCAAAPDDARKRVALLSAAFRLVRRERPDARLVVIRPCDPETVRRNGLDGEGIELLDPVSEPELLAPAYRRAWVSALPSYREAFGVVLIESLACGAPRSAWIGFAGVVLLLGVLRYRSLFVAGALALVLAAFAFPASVHKVEQRFGDLSSRSASGSSNSWAWRTGQWKRMLPYGYRRPLTGQGFGSYSRLTVKEFGTQDPDHPTIADRSHLATSQLGFAAHNDYVRSMVETGVPGLVLWVLFLVGLVSVPFGARRRGGVAPYACAAVAIGAALVMMSGADNISGYTVVLLYAAALAGGVAGAERGSSLRSAPRLRRSSGPR